jgi:hypothetical protein
MKGKWRAALLCCSLGISIGYGEVVTAESNVFTFPAITIGVVAKNILPPQNYFKHSMIRPSDRSITFSWAFPGSANEKPGAITVYSLLGKVVAKIPVRQKIGSAAWQLTPSSCKNGLFIARISYNENVKNLKLMLWK